MIVRLSGVFKVFKGGWAFSEKIFDSKKIFSFIQILKFKGLKSMTARDANVLGV